MLLFTLCFFWFLVATGFGYVISYPERIKNLPRVGLGFIFLSFVAGVTILICAIAMI